MYERFGKRALDLALAALCLILLSPLLLVVAAAIWLSDGFPMIFRQTRDGRDGSTFVIFKFRTYPVGTPELSSADAAALKPTPLGVFLRRTNLDELPQLFNILIGDMSFVGPRPGLPSQLVQAQIRRENGAGRLRPGLTGLAQLRGVTGMTEAEKARNDGEYAGKITFPGDLWIMARTALFILKRPPVY